MILHKVQNVEALTDFVLLVTFKNQEMRIYDVKPLLKRWEAFLPLEEQLGLFEQVRVDTGGYGVSWNDEIDLSCDELYFNGKRPPVTMPAANLEQ